MRRPGGNGCTQKMASTGALAAIYGKAEGDKEKHLENSLQSWWGEYADRKNNEDGEAVADSLLYDKNTLPRAAPAPTHASTGESAEAIRLKEKEKDRQQK